ncbi:hypothetical protein GCM10009564_18190 [Streptomyces thermogriseus]|uniref:DUF397 domain-containing protein n=2 Tax=Streptomyces TaxID=1883 RepID=A0ABN1SWJ8_9ACTN
MHHDAENASPQRGYTGEEYPMNDNLYTLPVENIETTNFCGGPCTEGCVDVAAIPGAADAFVVRDSKPEGAGRELRFTAAELDDFALGWVKSRDLTA